MRCHCAWENCNSKATYPHSCKILESFYFNFRDFYLIYVKKFSHQGKWRKEKKRNWHHVVSNPCSCIETRGLLLNLWKNPATNLGRNFSILKLWNICFYKESGWNVCSNAICFLRWMFAAVVGLGVCNTALQFVFWDGCLQLLLVWVFVTQQRNLCFRSHEAIWLIYILFTTSATAPAEKPMNKAFYDALVIVVFLFSEYEMPFHKLDFVLWIQG